MITNRRAVADVRVDLPFLLSEFIIDPERNVPLEVADKIMEHHIKPMLPFRLKSGVMIWPSERSCFRNKIWETTQGRNPDKTGKEYWSAHAFEPRRHDPEGKGACDWTAMKRKLVLLGEELANPVNPYRRVCYYPGNYFYHCDYDNDKAKGIWVNSGGWKETTADAMLEIVWRDVKNGA